jgi:hypothetical protein
MDPFADSDTFADAVSEEAEADTPLARLVAAVQIGKVLTERADAMVDAYVAAAREAGCSWADIGAALDITRQAAHLRFAGRVEGPAGNWPAGFSEGARRAVGRADEHARRLGHDPLGTQHLLLALTGREQDPTGRLLTRLGLTPGGVEADLAHLGQPPGTALISSPRLAPGLQRTLDDARDHAERLGHPAVRTAHLLLALSDDTGLAAKILYGRHPLTPEWLRTEVARLLRVDPARLAGLPGRRRRRGRQARTEERG